MRNSSKKESRRTGVSIMESPSPMYYADPDGNQMEFQVDCFDSLEEANSFMYGPAFASNPVGVEFNPDEWLARLRAGAPASDFLIRQTDETASPIRGALAR